MSMFVLLLKAEETEKYKKEKRRRLDESSTVDKNKTGQKTQE